MAFKTISDLLEKAESLKGTSIKSLLGKNSFGKGKGAIGQIIEQEGFGVKNNNDARPDFEELGIELKVLPLKKASKGELSVKERTKVCSINYKGLIEENWSTSHAKNKLNKILFVFYLYDKEDPSRSEILDYLLFHLENSDEPLIRSDWERTKKLVQDGKAHELSESQNVILAASRSGAGKLPENEWPVQPNPKYSLRARQRAFSLKPSFTKTLWIEVSKPYTLERILDKHKYSNYEELEDYILGKLNRWEGYTLSEFAEAHKVKITKGKNANALILRTALGFYEEKKLIKEILQLGIMVKTVPCRPNDLYPYESMSFPFQPLGEIREEVRFDESEFYTFLQGFLIIPLIRNDRKDSKPSKVKFGHSIIWRPSKKQLLEIQKEWERANNIIKEGIEVKKVRSNNSKGFILKNNLLKESDTEYIHMRPHARDSDDIDESIKPRISKQCFWFNKKFIQNLLLGGNK